MIQRIQTIFMIIATLCAAALHYTGMDVVVFGSMYYQASLSLLSFLLGIVAIFSYKNRKRQIMLNTINIFINVLLIVLLGFWFLTLSGGIDFPEKGIEPVFPIVALFCLLMANTYIRRDERLVKSVDRLR